VKPTRVAITVAGITLLAIALTAADQQREADALIPEELAKIWDAEHVSPPLPPLLDHRDLLRRLEDLVRSSPDLFAMEKAGESIEGRGIYHITLGRGPVGVLVWSQMHGDEPTATSALLDVFEYVRRREREPAVRRLLSTLTLHVVPMLNPDGAERFQRRNAQGIDINRDALRLQTPEGRILKEIRDRWRPSVGFNLHNQNWRTSIGDPPKPASVSLLSVAFDAARSDSPGRQLTRKLCAVIRDALEPFAPGQIGRYDDEFEVRAFGDNVTLWGTPVVLIETGGWPSPQPDAALVRLNFIAILAALDSLASKRVEQADPQRYESLPLNQSRAFYVLVRNATVINGAGVPPFTADIGVIANRRVRQAAGSRDLQVSLVIDDIGDLRTSGGLTTIDASGMTVVPADDDFEVGRVVDLPEWKSKRPISIGVGEPPRFALLKPASEPGKYVVAAVIK
jgi:zinc carboxypeptidase